MSILDLKQIRKLLLDAIEIKSRRVLYHILNDTFGEMEEILIPFVDAFNDYLKEVSDIDKNLIDKIYYADANWEYCDDFNDEGCWSFKNLKFLDELGNDLKISQEDIQWMTIDEYLQDWLKCGIGRYLKQNSRLQIKI